MNTEKNQKIWIEQVHENLILRGRSEKTFINYQCRILQFFNYFEHKTNRLCKLLISKILENEFISNISRKFKPFTCKKCGSTKFNYFFKYQRLCIN